MTPRQKLVAGAAWANGFSASTTKLIGLLEVFGAVGLVVPMLTGVLPWFTPQGAVGLALLTGGAVTLHLLNGGYLYTPAAGRVAEHLCRL